MEKAVLETGKRQLMGKKVRSLRREGIIPANVYGHGINSLALECQEKDLEKIIKEGTSRIIMLNIKGERKKRSVLIKNISYHPISRSLMHIDFYQVRMTEKMSAEIPIVLTGKAPALEFKENFIDHQLNELSIECLPDRLPPHIEVDISGLEEAGQAVYVRDLKPGEGITIVTPGDHLVVRVVHAAKVEEEVEEEEEAEEADGIDEEEEEAEGKAPEEDEE